MREQERARLEEEKGAIERNLKAVEEELANVKDRYKQLEDKIYQTSGLRLGNLKPTLSQMKHPHFHLDLSRTLYTPDKTLATIGDASESPPMPLSSFR
jgi:predicted nuclease with TOPRIM domain